jgi:hypothetical protein
MSGNDIKELDWEEKRSKLWKRSNEEKMEGCRRLIGVMDRMEAELLKVRPMTEEERRKGAKIAKAHCTIPIVERLAVGVPAEALVRKAPIRSTIANEDWKRV